MKIQHRDLLQDSTKNPGHEQFNMLGFVLRCFFLRIVPWLDYHMNLKPPFERLFAYIIIYLPSIQEANRRTGDGVFQTSKVWILEKD